MQQRALQTVLLIQAIEETDPTGEALPVADRVEATRSVAPSGAVAADESAQPAPSSVMEEFLTRRADLLVAKLRARSPGLEHVFTAASGVPALDRVLLVFAFVAGAVLASLDGHHRINIFAFPLLAVIIWNLIVYFVRISRAFRGAPTDAPRWGFWFGHVYARRVRAHVDALLGHSGRFNAPLAPGLRRFAGDWWEIAQPLLMLRARRVLHLAAALVGLGLIAGFYFQSLALRYPAGWDGSPLSASSAHVILMGLYGPGAALGGLEIPSSEQVASLRWNAAAAPPPGAGPVDATLWANLIAWTALLYIVIPRLIGALIASIAHWRLSRHLAAPPALSTYARTLLARAGSVSS
jgi:hypothetical protein